MKTLAPLLRLSILTIASAALAAPPSIDTPPRITLSADSASAVFTFDTAAPARATLRWGPSFSALSNSVSDGGGTFRHILQTAPLPRDSVVFYEVSSSSGFAHSNSFLTPPPAAPAAAFRFAIHGDLEGGLEDNAATAIPNARDVSAGIVRFAPHVVVSTGDLADEAYGGFSSFPPWLAWTNFVKICSNEFSSAPFLPAIGNHDGRHPSSSGTEYEYTGDQPLSHFHRFFTLPETAPASVNYSARIADATFIFLNSDADIPAQRDFLARALQQAAYDPSNLFTFAVFHRPPYSWSGHAGNDEIRTHWCPLFTAYEADAVFCGHIHNYQRPWPIDGVQYLVAGGAGAYLKDSAPDPSLAFTTTCFHYVTASVSNRTASFLACRADHDPLSNPQVFDAFSVTADRHVRVSPVFPRPGQTATITYDPAGSPLAASPSVALHWGVDDFASASTLPMTPLPDGTFTTSLTVPPSASRRLAFCFKNDPASPTLWDNNHNADWQALFASDDPAPATPSTPYAVLASPVVTDDPPDKAMNNTGPSVVDAFDFDASSPVASPAALPSGFGSLGALHVNFDADNLYLGSSSLDLGGTDNVAVVFLSVDTLSDDAWNLWHKSSLPNALDLLHNVRFTEPMDIAIVLGDQYGDKTTYTNFTYAGHDFGQGIYYLSTNSSVFSPIPPPARLSQFADPLPPASASGNRPSTVWEASIPWAALNASAPEDVSHLFLCGLIASASVSGNDRYLSRSVLASRAWGKTDPYGNIGTNSLILAPIRVSLPHGHLLGDEIPDAFRIRYYGSPDFPPASADTDADSLSTLQEYIAGTDPTDPASRLRLNPDLSVSPAPLPGRTLTLQASTNLLDPSAWTSTPPASAPFLFYRAAISLP